MDNYRPTTRNFASTSEAPASEKSVPTKQRTIKGIPPVKEPSLPPKRGASLVACTKTRRAYWDIFKQTDHGWQWERSIPAVPLLDKKAHTTQSVVSSTDTPIPKLDMGGQYWEGWCCPGCKQKEIREGSNYLHYQPCKCGIDCCLGQGDDAGSYPTCPNCGAVIIRRTGITRTLSNVTRGKLDLGDSRTLPGPERREIEG